MALLKNKFVVVYVAGLFLFLFALSFLGKPSINAAVVFDTSGFIETMKNNAFFLLFGIALCIAFAIYMIRHGHEMSSAFHHSRIKVYTAVSIFVVLFSFFGFVMYVDEKGDKVTGYASKPLSLAEIKKITGPCYSFAPDEGCYTYAKAQLEKQKNDALVGEATFQAMNMFLGKYAYEYVSDYCKDQAKRSTPENKQPTSVSVDGNQVKSGTENKTAQCPYPVTTITAQGKKTKQQLGFSYEVSWSVAACKQEVDYLIQLTNAEGGSFGLKSGKAGKGNVLAEYRTLTRTEAYSQICITSTDSSIGENGKVCFNLLSQ